MVGGYTFGNEKDAALARDEEKRVYYINSKLNWADPENVLIIYNRLIEKKMFVTPIGQDFLKNVYNKLVVSGVLNTDEISGVPVYSSYTAEHEIEKEVLPLRRVKPVPEKNYKREYDICRLVILGLVFVIIVMFVITLKSPNPNIINYETAVLNKYAAWDNELSEREAKIREKERELFDE